MTDDEEIKWKRCEETFDVKRKTIKTLKENLAENLCDLILGRVHRHETESMICRGGKDCT